MKEIDKEILRQAIRKRIESEKDIDFPDFPKEFNLAIANIYQTYPEKEIDKEIVNILNEET